MMLSVFLNKCKAKIFVRDGQTSHAVTDSHDRQKETQRQIDSLYLDTDSESFKKQAEDKIQHGNKFAMGNITVSFLKKFCPQYFLSAYTNIGK